MKKKISTEELLDQCLELYRAHGISAFLYKNMDHTLYQRLYHRNVRISDVLEHFGLSSEFDDYKKNNSHWNWGKLISAIEPIVKEQNFLPPAAWFQANGHAKLVQAVYSLGKTWDSLRRNFDSYENSSFVISRNGLRWRSHPEASLSNFLYSRGIPHVTGKKYPPEYAKETGQTYGYYDLEFTDKQERVISVEIWGQKPNGHAEEHYALNAMTKTGYQL